MYLKINYKLVFFIKSNRIYQKGAQNATQTKTQQAITRKQPVVQRIKQQHHSMPFKQQATTTMSSLTSSGCWPDKETCKDQATASNTSCTNQN